jgi:hypothetical protein
VDGGHEKLLDHNYSQKGGRIGQLPMAEMRSDTRKAERSEHRLYYGRSARPVVEVIPDDAYIGMFRVVAGGISDRVNLARALDAALVIAERGPPYATADC